MYKEVNEQPQNLADEVAVNDVVDEVAVNDVVDEVENNQPAHVDNMDVDGETDGNIDDVVLARQRKLDKGKGVMKGKNKQTKKGVPNFPRTTGITIRENCNPHVSSDSDTESDDLNDKNVDESSDYESFESVVKHTSLLIILVMVKMRSSNSESAYYKTNIQHLMIKKMNNNNQQMTMTPL